MKSTRESKMMNSLPSIRVFFWNIGDWIKEMSERIARPFVVWWNKIKERWNLFTFAFKKGTGKKAKRWLVFFSAVFSSIEQVRVMTYYLDPAEKGGVW